MAEEKDEEQIGKQGPARPASRASSQPTGEQSQQQPTGQQGQSSSGQTDLGQGGDTATLSGEQRGFGLAQVAPAAAKAPAARVARKAAAAASSARRAAARASICRKKARPASRISRQQGQGALEDEDIETGQPQSRDSDIEGSSGNV